MKFNFILRVLFSSIFLNITYINIAYAENKKVILNYNLPENFKCKNPNDLNLLNLNFANKITKSNKKDIETLTTQLNKKTPYIVIEKLKNDSQILNELFLTSARVRERSPEPKYISLNQKGELNLTRYDENEHPISARYNNENKLEPLSIQEHTELVIQQFIQRKSCYHLNEKDTKFMIIYLALHDIGKGCSDSNINQHKFTTPIVETVLAEMNYDKKDIYLASALVSHDPIGEYLQNKISLNKAVNMIEESIKHSGIGKTRFLKLLKAFYISDSSSYEDLGPKLYKSIDSNNCLIFNDNANSKLNNLWEKIN